MVGLQIASSICKLVSHLLGILGAKMQITNTESLRALNVGATQRTQPIAAPSGAQNTASTPNQGPAAHVEISDEARSLAVAKKAMSAVPETRDDLVSTIKSQVDNGTYKVSASDIAEQMIRRATADTIR